MLVYMLLGFGCGGSSQDEVDEAPGIKPKISCNPGDQLRLAPDGLQQWCEHPDGKMHGPMVKLFPDGTRKMFGRYDNGQADDEWMWWHDNGQQAQTGKYSKGRQTGSWTWWHPNGKRAEAGDFLANRKAGQWTTWYESGARKEEGLYHNGQKVGLWTYFNDDDTNTISRTEEYQNDVLVEVNGEKVDGTPQAPKAPSSN